MGGYRPGSGAKKGQHRIHVKELRDAIEKRLGMPYQEALANTFAKLYTDFMNDVNVREYLTFNEHMNKRIVEHQVTEVSMINPVEELSAEEIKARIGKLLALEKAEANVKDNSDESDFIESESENKEGE